MGGPLHPPSTALYTPAELLEKLAALVPSPREHLLHSHGVLSPAAPWRADIVPPPTPVTVTDGAGSPGNRRTRRSGNPVKDTWIPWMDLLRRVFRIELLPWPRCGGRAYVQSHVLPPTREVRVAAGLPTGSAAGPRPRAGPRDPTETWILLDGSRAPHRDLAPSQGRAGPDVLPAGRIVPAGSPLPASATPGEARSPPRKAGQGGPGPPPGTRHPPNAP